MLDIFLVYLVTWFEDFFKKDFFLNNSFIVLDNNNVNNVAKTL